MMVQLTDGKMVPASEALESAWKLIDRPWKWCQHKSETFGQYGPFEFKQYCSYGALAAVLKGREVDEPDVDEPDAITIQTRWGTHYAEWHHQEVRRPALLEELASFLNTASFALDGTDSYIAFNDHNFWISVRGMWKLAIATARRFEQDEFLNKLLAPLPEELDHVNSEQTVSAEDAERDLVSAL